tara:strand:- start:8453 stop:8881 length:429 start_codon:yes stop_codon:yes gene_type:complete
MIVEPVFEETNMTDSAVTRREFTLALAGGAALAADQSTGIGQDVAPQKTAPKSQSAEKSANNTTETSNRPTDEPEAREPPPEAAYLFGLIMRRYTDGRLDEVAVNGIARDIYSDLARSQVLSSFPLDNSDEPGFTFRAWRAD